MKAQHIKQIKDQLAEINEHDISNQTSYDNLDDMLGDVEDLEDLIMRLMEEDE